MPINKRKAAARKAVATRQNTATAKAVTPKEHEVKAEEEQQDSGSESESDANTEDEEMKDASDEEKDSESESSSSSDEEEEEEKATEKEQEVAEDDDEKSSSSSSDSEDEEEENSKKRKAEDDLEEEQQPVKALKVEFIPKGPKTSFTVFVGQLNYDATYDQVKEHFSKCGEVKEIRLSSYGVDGKKNKGTCFIDFEDKEGHDAALKLNGTEFMGRKIKVDHDEPRKKEPLSEESNILFYANLDWGVTEKQLEHLFSQHGQIVSVTLLTKPGPERQSKGCGYIEFEEKESAVKAFAALRDSTIDGRPLRLDYAGPRGSQKINHRPRQEKGGFKKGGFNKGGFKKGGFNKGGFKKGGFKNGNNRGQGEANSR